MGVRVWGLGFGVKALTVGGRKAVRGFWVLGLGCSGLGGLLTRWHPSSLALDT